MTIKLMLSFDEATAITTALKKHSEALREQNESNSDMVEQWAQDADKLVLFISDRIQQENKKVTK
jgi:hypothetical protein